MAGGDGHILPSAPLAKPPDNCSMAVGVMDSFNPAGWPVNGY